MKTPMYKLFLLAALFSGSVLINSCSKSDDISSLSTPTARQTNTSTDATMATQAMRSSFAPSGAVNPMAGLFNQTLLVSSAKTAGGSGPADYNNITSQFQGYSFQFEASKDGTGTATATNGRSPIYGKWTMDSQDNSINFSFPTDQLSSLSFMNQNWKIDNSGSTTGTSDNPTSTNLVSSNGDVLHFSSPNGPR
jgi:hypothetical protein